MDSVCEKCCIEEGRKSMKTLKEEVMKMLMDRIGVAEGETTYKK